VRVATPKVGLTIANFLDRLLDPAAKLGTSTPNADPAGDYTWFIFHRSDVVHPGAFSIVDEQAQEIVGTTPLRQILQWRRLLLLRRMIGVAAFAYIVAHFLLYATDQAFDVPKIASEIVLRVYLTIGFIALLRLAVLAATSTDAIIRRMGRLNWERLHRFVYAIGILAVIHFCFQSKLELWELTWMAGLLGWLLLYRVMARVGGIRGRLSLGWAAGLSVAAAFGTALGEATFITSHSTRRCCWCCRLI
jgi:hypothetical protein